MAKQRRERQEISVLTLGRHIIDTLPERIHELHPERALLSLAEQARRAG